MTWVRHDTSCRKHDLPSLRQHLREAYVSAACSASIVEFLRDECFTTQTADTSVTPPPTLPPTVKAASDLDVAELQAAQSPRNYENMLVVIGVHGARWNQPIVHAYSFNTRVSFID